jgi:hypothetical protein
VPPQAVLAPAQVGPAVGPEVKLMVVPIWLYSAAARSALSSAKTEDV